MRIARFTTGEDRVFGVVTGELDEFGQPGRGQRRGRAGRRPALRRDQAARRGAPARGRPAAGAGASRAARWSAIGTQLRRPRRRDGQRGARGAVDVPQAQHLASSAPATRSSTRRRPQTRRLRGRARRGDRPDLPRRTRRAGDRRDLRLHDRQRRDRARPAEAATCSAPGPRASTPSARSARGSRPTSTRSDFADGVRVQTYLNGDLVQDGSTKDLIFDIPTLVAHIVRA